MRPPSASTQQKFIKDKVKEWQTKLHLGERLIHVQFAKEKDNWEIDGHYIPMASTYQELISSKGEPTAYSYYVKIGFREEYDKYDWEAYDNFYHMAETTVIHELLHVKTGPLLTHLRSLIEDKTTERLTHEGHFLEREEWMIDSLARAIYDLAHNGR